MSTDDDDRVARVLADADLIRRVDQAARRRDRGDRMALFVLVFGLVLFAVAAALGLLGG